MWLKHGSISSAALLLLGIGAVAWLRSLGIITTAAVTQSVIETLFWACLTVFGISWAIHAAEEKSPPQ
jgi:hypothetical protein